MSELFPLALPEGTILAGQYIIRKTLGQGGFGITYMASDHKSGGRVAVKEFFPDTLATRMKNTVSSYPGERTESFEYGKQCFLQEAETLAQFIGSDNIVRIHSYFEENGTAYFVMDFVEGTSFDEYIRQKGGKIPYADAERILLPVMDALSLVHSKGIVYRDVTPDNIYITNEGTVKLLDFGAARYSLGDKSRSLDVVLKHGFAPKEQYTRHGRQGPFTDVYTVGASFYYAVTGRRPPDSIDRLEEDDLIPPSSLGVAIPPKKEDAVLKAMSVQPGDRYQTMDAFKKALREEETQFQPQKADGQTAQMGQRFFDVPEPQFEQQTVMESAGPQEKAGALTAAELSAMEDSAQPRQKEEKNQEQSGRKKRKKRPGFSFLRNRKLICAGIGVLVLAVVFISVMEMLGNRGKKNVLMADDGAETDKVFDSALLRSEVTDIVITDSLREMSAAAWDVSESGNGRVMAWTSQTADGLTLYIGGKGGVSLGESARGLFQGYTALKSFNCRQSKKTVLRTDRVKDMSHMFAGCVSLEKLSLGITNTYLDTENVTDMSYMFADCASLEEVDLSALDLPRLQSVRAMFQNCGSLIEARGGIVSYSSVVTDMSGMFQNCSGITEQSMVSWIPDTAENLSYMFAGCVNMVADESSGGVYYLLDDVPADADVSAMLYGCDGLKERLEDRRLVNLTDEQWDSLWIMPGLMGTSTEEKGGESRLLDEADAVGQVSDPTDISSAGPITEEVGWDAAEGEAPFLLLPPPEDEYLQQLPSGGDPYEKLAFDSFEVNNIKNEGSRAFIEAENSYFATPNTLERMGIEEDVVIEDVTPRAVVSYDSDTLLFVNDRDGCAYLAVNLSDETNEDAVAIRFLGFAGKGEERYRIRTCYMSPTYICVWAEDGNGENGRLCRYCLNEDDEVLLTGWTAVESPKQVTFAGGYVYYVGRDTDGGDALYRVPTGGDWNSPEQLAAYVAYISVLELLTDGEKVYVWQEGNSAQISWRYKWQAFDSAGDRLLAEDALTTKLYENMGYKTLEDMKSLDCYDVSVYEGYLYFIAQEINEDVCMVIRTSMEEGENGRNSVEELFSTGGYIDSGYVMSGLSIHEFSDGGCEISVRGAGADGLRDYFFDIYDDGSYDYGKPVTFDYGWDQ